MGLDITAYKNLNVVDNPIFDEDGDLLEEETQWQPGEGMKWSEEHFPGRGEGIDPDKVYEWEEELGFRAGSYFGYGWWRLKLKVFKGDTAFQELIDFADNEGVIGPIVSNKLFKDFVDHLEEAKKFSKTIENGETWLDLYEKWLEAFRFASENGAVDFH